MPKSHSTLKDNESGNEILLACEESNNQFELRENYLNVKIKESETDEAIVEKAVDNAQKVKTERSMFNALNLILLIVLTVWITTILIVKFDGNMLMCDKSRYIDRAARSLIKLFIVGNENWQQEMELSEKPVSEKCLIQKKFGSK